MKTPKILLLFIAALVVLSLQGCDQRTRQSTSSTFVEIQQKKELRVGYIVFPPCVIKDPTTAELSGHFIATVKEICKQAGWKVTFEEADWSTFAAGLQTKRFDLSIAPTFVTIPRATAVSFSKPLFYAGNSAIVKKGEQRFTTIESLNKVGIKIAVTQGEAGHEYAKANLTNATLTVLSGSDQTLAFTEVQAGRADIALGDAYMTSKFAAAHPNDATDLFVANPYNLTPVSWAVRHDDQDFLQFINSSIEALDSQEKLSQFETDAGAHWLHPKVEWMTK